MNLDIEELLSKPIKEKYSAKKVSDQVLTPNTDSQKRSRSREPAEKLNQRPSSRSREDRYSSRRPISPRRHSRSRGRSPSRESRYDSHRRVSRQSRERYERDYRDERRERYRSRDRYRSKSRDRYRSRSPRRRRSRSKDRYLHRARDYRKEVTELTAHRPRQPSPVLDPAKRDDRTVFCSQLAARLTNRDLHDFLLPCGRIREAKIVVDKLSKRSKGVAYVEFYEEESVPKAINMTGQKLLGIPIIIHSSESEKNRLGEAAVTSILSAPKSAEPTNKLFIGNLHARVTEKDLRDLFETCGDLDSVKVHIDSATGRSKGYAFVEFRDAYDARKATVRYNDYDLYGRKIHVGPFNEKSSREIQYRGLDDTLKLDGTARLELMNKLARDDVKAITASKEPRPPSESVCVLLKNMFDLSEETSATWQRDIEEDVRLECENYGKVLHIAIDPKSLGYVYVKLDSVRSARRVLDALNGKYFDNRKITGQFFAESDYYSLYPRA